jgi:CysZ protein
MELFRGLQLILANPRLWPLCLRPLLWALAGYVVLGALVWWLLVPFLSTWVSGFGVASSLAGAALTVGLVVLWLYLFPVLFIGITGAFASFFWDRLSLEVERIVGGEPPETKVPAGAMLLDSLARFVLALAATVLTIIGAVFTGPVAPAIAAGILGLLDFTSPAALRRGWLLGDQKRRLFRPDCFGFAVAVGIASLIPILNLFVWPAAVAGGTLLVRRLEARAS